MKPPLLRVVRLVLLRHGPQNPGTNPMLRMQQADATRSRIQRALERPKGSYLNNDGANRCFSGDLATCFFSLSLLNQVPTTDQRGASSSHQVQADGAIPYFFWVGRDCKTFRELCQHAILRDFELLCISSIVLSTCYGRKRRIGTTHQLKENNPDLSKLGGL